MRRSLRALSTLVADAVPAGRIALGARGELERLSRYLELPRLIRLIRLINSGISYSLVLDPLTTVRARPHQTGPPRPFPAGGARTRQ